MLVLEDIGEEAFAMSRYGIGSAASVLERNLSRSTGLPFRDLLTDEAGRILAREGGVTFREKIYTPVVTLLAFIAQLLDADGSCRKAVARVIATLVASGREAPSNNTSAYCQARKRLPERLFEKALQWCAKQLEDRAPMEKQWLGRHRVRCVDGSSAQTPDTPENRDEFGLPPNVKPGCGLPVVPFVGIFSLVTGALVGLATGRKGSHERHLFRKLWEIFRPGDVALGDRGFCSYADIARLHAMGVHSVFRILNRDVDFRRGRRLGKHDHIVTWEKPKTCPRGLSKEEFDALPGGLTLREVRVYVRRKGFRTKVIDLVTTLLDAEVYTKEELAGLYRRRWEADVSHPQCTHKFQPASLSCA